MSNTIENAAYETERQVDRIAHEAKAGFQATTAQFEQVQTKMKENMEKTLKTAEQMVSFGQGNLEAVMKSSQIWASGMQDLTKHVAANAQAHLEEAVSTFRSLTSVKSLKEAMDLQSGYARTAMERAMAESGKLTETSMKLAEQAMAPLTARMNLAVETFSKTV